MKTSAIVVAAGSGSRMQSNVKKTYLEINGIPLIIRTLRVLEQSQVIKEVVLVVAEQDIEDAKRLVEQYGLRKINRYAPGGEDRQGSVYNGIQAVDEQAELILVHDGARPFVTLQEIERVVEQAGRYGAATIATPVKDTVKKVADGIVQETIPRSSLYSVQTPQVFEAARLREAHLKAREQGYQGTDDASLFERLGYPVRIVEGSYRNIKLTTPEDLLIAAVFLQNESESLRIR